MKILLLLPLAALLTLGVNAEDSSCKKPKPDFRAPGRRISHQKCLEYNWERQNADKCSPASQANNRYPYMGAIGYTEEDKKDLTLLCAGFLVSPQFVVTVAHCLERNLGLPEPQIVRFENEDLANDVPRTDVKILRKIVHPEYNPQDRSYDIGLVELETELPLTKSVMPACLWNKGEADSSVAGTVAAWASKNNEPIPTTIRTMPVQVLDSRTCLTQVPSHLRRIWRRLEDHQLCANETNINDFFCKGSSGAPIITSVAVDGGEGKMPYALGVTAFGFGCNPGFSIYTRVSSFVDWIEKTVWANNSFYYN